MGTWGEDIFENDDAGDYADHLVDQLAARVDEILADEQRSRPDEDGEGMLMPSVEVIWLICKHARTCPPEEAVIRGWKEQYLHIFDGYFSDGEAGVDTQSDFYLQRRKVIEDTFLKLESLAHACDQISSTIQ